MFKLYEAFCKQDRKLTGNISFYKTPNLFATGINEMVKEQGVSNEVIEWATWFIGFHISTARSGSVRQARKEIPRPKKMTVSEWRDKVDSLGPDAVTFLDIYSWMPSIDWRKSVWPAMLGVQIDKSQKKIACTAMHRISPLSSKVQAAGILTEFLALTNTAQEAVLSVCSAEVDLDTAMRSWK